MINYPGAKAIEDVREKAAKHKDSEQISSQIIEDFIKHFKLPSIQEVWVALQNKLQTVALHFIFQATSNQIEELPKKRKYTKEEKENYQKRRESLRKRNHPLQKCLYKSNNPLQKCLLQLSLKHHKKKLRNNQKRSLKVIVSSNTYLNVNLTFISFSARQSKAREEDKWWTSKIKKN